MQPPQEWIDRYPAEWDQEKGPYRGQNGYLPHPRPRAGYAAMISDLDEHVGAILQRLEAHGLVENTLVIFTSDNGPWLSYGDHAGSAGPLREGKGTEFDGGVREPCVMRWPGKIAAGTVCDEPAMTIDLLPTVAELLGVTLDANRKIDGLDISPLLFGDADVKSPHEALFFYWGDELQAVRSGPWKLHFPHGYRKFLSGGTGGQPAPYGQDTIELSLFNLDDDVGETRNVASAHPEVVARLEALADAMRADLGDSAQKRKGSGVREPGRLTQ
jgi:arylsulfatase A-like enzyme